MTAFARDALDVYKPYFNKIHGFVRYKGMWLSHAPIHPDELRGKMNVHGHCHNKPVNDPRYICVSAEQVNGQPLELEKILERRVAPDTGTPIAADRPLSQENENLD